MDLWTMRCRAPGRLPWKSLATFPPRVPSPTSSTELYSFCIKSRKVKTNRITGQSTTTGKVPLIKERFLSKQTGPPLSIAPCVGVAFGYGSKTHGCRDSSRRGICFNATANRSSLHHENLVLLENLAKFGILSNVGKVRVVSELVVPIESVRQACV